MLSFVNDYQITRELHHWAGAKNHHQYWTYTTFFFVSHITCESVLRWWISRGVHGRGGCDYDVVVEEVKEVK